MMTNINIIRIKTNSWKEEDFLLMTDLSETQIKKVIQPMVDKERNSDGDSYYTNDEYVDALTREYPDNISDYYHDDNLDTMTF
jgi:hypothetical protein